MSTPKEHTNETTRSIPVKAEAVSPKESVGKPKSSIPYEIFTNSLQRAKNLVDIDTGKDGKKLPIPKCNLEDAYRAAIVLSISALDAYIRTFVLERIKILLSNKSLPTKLKEYIKKVLFDKDTLHTIVFETTFYEKIEEEFSKDFQKQSFQGHRNIESYMAIAGYDDIFRQISKKADRSHDNLRSDIEKYTSRRHEIAHCGDHDLNQTKPTENKITKKYTQECIDLVDSIAKHIHKISLEEK
jgi:hypothetical protein